jgi:hypothetical protein
MTPSDRGADLDPVGRAIASAREARRVHKRLQPINRMGVEARQSWGTMLAVRLRMCEAKSDGGQCVLRMP